MYANPGIAVVTAPLDGRQRVLLLMDHSLDFVELLGGEGVIQGISSAIKAIGGYEPADLIGRHFEEIVHPDDRAAAATAFERVLRGDRIEPIALRYRRKDGSWRTVQASVRSFLDDPAVRAIVVLTRDVTDQICAETSLVEANVELRRLSQQLLVAHEEERSFIARELHDDVQQILVGLRMSMEPARKVRAADPTAVMIDTWSGLVTDALDHLHDLTMVLRKPAIGERGLPTEMRAFVERLTLAERHKIHLDIGAGIGRLGDAVELACFRIVQEALTNALKHAHATQVQVRLIHVGDDLTVSIRDDGVGFDVKAARARAVAFGNIGLLSMRERVALAGGRL